MTVSSHPRNFDTVDLKRRVPVYVVWELTLACNLRCTHCGSRAGESRISELSTDECLALVDRLAELGTREITLIGGEAFLRRDWLEIVQRIARRGILCTLQTGGYGLGEELIRRAQSAGLSGVGVSVDGLETTHDILRGRIGSYRSALTALEFAHKVGIETSANTQINSKSAAELPELYELLRTCGIRAWQLQLTVAMGNAADNSNILIQPYELSELMPMIASLTRRGSADGIRIIPGNNIGYFGPYEHLLRGPDFSSDVYDGCRAGIDGMGIEADGTVKGCPSLATARYSEGNLRKVDIGKLWHGQGKFSLNRTDPRTYSGYCSECYYRDSCRSGCVWTSDSLFGEAGNNPYCYYRVLELKKQNIREKVVKVTEAENASFATGKFSIVQEEWNEQA
ncbi:radical SAM protein [Bradyrhizobium sp. HKCCYLRH3099]|uniref:radical SAM protein n=1 Tax=unclassified Bradyrhizobium TaxID=2631580 RepID=UPI003EBE8292